VNVAYCRGAWRDAQGIASSSFEGGNAGRDKLDRRELPERQGDTVDLLKTAMAEKRQPYAHINNRSEKCAVDDSGTLGIHLRKRGRFTYLPSIAIGVRNDILSLSRPLLDRRDLPMMNSEEFTQFLNELRAAYDLPTEFEKGALVSPSEETDNSEALLTEDDCSRLQPQDDTHT
jgi:hypothetical protein